MAIVILPDSTRLDLLDDMAREVYGIVDADAPLDSTSDAYRWRWAMDELVQQMSEEEFREALDYIARAHDVDVIEMDEVAYTIINALCCTVDAAIAMREYLFDGCTDLPEHLETLRRNLEQFYEWYPDDAAFEDEGYIYVDGELYEVIPGNGAPMRCEAEALFDASFGYLVVYR